MESLVERVAGPLLRQLGPEERQQRIPAVETAWLGHREVDEERQPFRLMDDVFDLCPLSSKGHVAERAELDSVRWGVRGASGPLRDIKRIPKPTSGHKSKK